jgi:DNA-directed RNA polymerase subunit RPC12/RpoP
MKAITCTQCGATIENVSENSVIIHCEYCGARIMIDRVSKPSSLPDHEPVVFDAGPTTTPPVTIIALAVAGVVVIPLIIGVFVLKKPKVVEPQKVYSAPSSPVTFSTPSWTAATEPPKPTPVVNYQPRVSWDGPNDMEYFDDPEVDFTSVADLSSDEIKKTVFKNRTVKLRVIINAEGEIDSVETISGHPILVEAATRSAKRSIFRNRSKPTTRILTYTFRVLED